MWSKVVAPGIPPKPPRGDWGGFKAPLFKGGLGGSGGWDLGEDLSFYQLVLTTPERWLSEGAPWFWPKAKPKNWNLEEQLQQIPTAFR